MLNSNNKKRGISLVEVIIYVALFATLSLVVINALIVTIRTARSARINHSVQEAGYGAMEYITRMIRDAETVDLNNSLFDNDSGFLNIVTHDSVGNLKTDAIYVSNYYYLNYGYPSKDIRSLQILENGASGSLPNAFTSRNIVVERLKFKLIQTANSTAVVVEIAVRDDRSPNAKVETFYNTVILKKKY